MESFVITDGDGVWREVDVSLAFFVGSAELSLEETRESTDVEERDVFFATYEGLSELPLEDALDDFV